MFYDANGGPIKPIHVRESEWNANHHWVANWTCPVLSCTSSFDIHEDLTHHLLQCGIREIEAEKQVCATSMPTAYLEGVTQASKRLKLNPAIEDQVTALCVICHSGQEMGKFVECWTCNQPDCSNTLPIQRMPLKTQAIGEIIYKDMLHPKLYDCREPRSAEKNREFRQKAGLRFPFSGTTMYPMPNTEHGYPAFSCAKCCCMLMMEFAKCIKS